MRTATERACWARNVIAVSLLVGLWLVCGCVFDESGLGWEPAVDGSTPDAQLTDAAQADAYVEPPDSALPDVYVPPCTGDTYECLGDGTARVCENEDWTVIGDCPLGCDAAARECRVTSNVPAELVDEGTWALDPPAGDSPVTINTDTGEIVGNTGTLRPPGPGLDGGSGIHYEQLGPDLGVFSMQGLTIPAGFEVFVIGQRALVLLVDGDAVIEGTLSLVGAGQVPGPGGHGGGASGQTGFGLCPGQPGSGVLSVHGCVSGGGGGGHGGPGGAGGNSNCGGGFTGGVGGPDTCGVPELVPLVGGSGGAGGTFMTNYGSTNPGLGGGGGGAVQISATTGISVTGNGGINAGGGGGTGCTSAGGSGGGAGGAILLEAPLVILTSGAVLAANGGGGGGGDCT